MSLFPSFRKSNTSSCTILSKIFNSNNVSIWVSLASTWAGMKFTANSAMPIDCLAVLDSLQASKIHATKWWISWTVLFEDRKLMTMSALSPSLSWCETSSSRYTSSVISHRLPLLKSESKYLLRFMDASAYSRKTDGRCDADFKTPSFRVYGLRCIPQCLQVSNASCKSWQLVLKDDIELHPKRNRVWCEWYISRLPARYPTHTIILIVSRYPKNYLLKWMSVSSGIFL